MFFKKLKEKDRNKFDFIYSCVIKSFVEERIKGVRLQLNQSNVIKHQYYFDIYFNDALIGFIDIKDEMYCQDYIEQIKILIYDYENK